MTARQATRFLSALAVALAAAGAVQAAPVKGSPDAYDYSFRAAPSAFTDGARGRDAFTDGARSGKFDVFTEGARTLAGLDRVSVSATPGRAYDVYTDGARGRDVFTDGARGGNVEVFTEGARSVA